MDLNHGRIVMKATISSILFLSLFCSQASADGMMFVYEGNMLRLHAENSQVAAIHHVNGVEHMLISIDVDANIAGDKAVWLFPVPSDPKAVDIDILETFPVFSLIPIEHYLREAIRDFAKLIVSYGTILSPLTLFLLYQDRVMDRMDRVAEQEKAAPAPEVTVHKRVEKTGFTTELITTKNQDALDRYLRGKGLNLPKDSRAVIDGYVGKNYSFAISYISNLNTLKSKDTTDFHSQKTFITMSVYVKFATETMYFPLLPTSVYGDMNIPVKLFVLGHVTPVFYPKIKANSWIFYCTEKDFTPPAELTTFFNTKSAIDTLEYTFIRLNSPSSSFTEDLWIHSSQPVPLRLAKSFIDYYWIYSLVLFLPLSVIASLLAGIAAFRTNPPSKKRLLFHGLWNGLTFYVFLVATILMRIKAGKGEKVRFITIFNLIFLGMLVALCIAIFNVI